MKTVAVIVAGGQGKRLGRPKQFIKVCGKPMLEWTLAAFQRSKVIDEIILVVAKEFMPLARKFRFYKLKKTVPSGKERPDSVYNGLKALPADTEIVAIHDGARPAITVKIVEASVKAARKSGAAIVGVPVKDTLKAVSRQPLVVSQTLDRSQIWQAQTPQVFKKEIILKAYKKGYNKYAVTDDSMLVERLGVPVTMVMGSYENIKVTTPDDLLVLAAILKGRE